MAILSSIANGISGFLGGGEYRESTLYDFSVAVKACLFVYEYNPNGNPDNILNPRFKPKDKLPLQINPSEYRSFKKMGQEGQINIDRNGSRNNTERNKTLDLELIFNVADEYAAISNNGLIPYDIDINTATPIKALFEYSTMQYRLLLKWGPLNFLSYVESIDCRYNLFSPYGEPLRASVNLTLHQHVEGFSNESKDVETLLGKTNWLQLKTYQVTSSALTFGQKAIETAANEALPTILKKERG